MLVEENKHRPRVLTNASDLRSDGHFESTFVFEFEQEEEHCSEGDGCKFQSKVRPFLIGTAASTLFLSFGVMLGWPSPTYPVLLDERTAPVPITMVQGPMIAGFLMFGATFATPFSYWTFHSNSKHGIMASLVVASLGWCVLWSAATFYHLMISRFLIGMGAGYGNGQIRTYIKDTVRSPALRTTLLKLINVHLILGALLAYIMGLFLNFYQFAMCALLITLFLIVLVSLVPNTSARCQQRTNKKNQSDLGVIDLFRKKQIRKDLILMIALVFVQQFSGGPATIVYCQFLFQVLGLQRPALCSVLYMLVFLVAYVLGTFFTSSLSNKKLCLAIGSLAIAILMMANALVLYLEVMSPILGLGLMLGYVFCYGCGWATVTNTMAAYLMPQTDLQLPLSQLQFMLFSMYAVIITKLFQVFYSLTLELWASFAVFAFVALFGLLIVVLFVPQKARMVQEALCSIK